MISRYIKYYLLSSLLLLPCCLAGCGDKQLPPGQFATRETISWQHAEGGLRMEISAARELNTFEGKPHSLLLCVYQLDNPEAFNTMSAREEGMNILLQCSPFDASIKMGSRIFMQPGENAAHRLDRAEGARYVAVAAGYFAPSGGHKRSGLWPMAVVANESGMLFKDYTYSPGVTRIRLHLDELGLRGEALGPDKPR